MTGGGGCWLAVAAGLLEIAMPAGCPPPPRPLTKIVRGRIVATRPVSPAAYEHATRPLLYEEEERWEEAAAELQRALPCDSEAPETNGHPAAPVTKWHGLADAADHVARCLRMRP